MNGAERRERPPVVLRVIALIAFAALLLPLVGFLMPVAAAQPGLSAPAANAIARLEPADAWVEVGKTVVVNMVIQDVVNMYGVDVRLKFDPALAQVEDADIYSDGTQIQPLYGFMRPDFVIKRVACNTVEPNNPDCAEAGFIWYAVTQLNPAPPVTGSGAIAAITFRGIAEGSASITMTYAKAADRYGNTIVLDRLDGRITVTNGPRPTPSPTGTPTPTETLTPSVTPTPSQTPTPTPIPDTATFDGWVFRDDDRDGLRDGDEPGLGGATVRVVCDSSAPVITMVSNPDGSFRADGLLLDTDYWIKQYPLPGYAFTTQPVVVVRFSSADPQRHAEVLFGNTPLRSNRRLHLPIVLGGNP